MKYDISFLKRKFGSPKYFNKEKRKLEDKLNDYEYELKKFSKMSNKEKLSYCDKINLNNGVHYAAQSKALSNLQSTDMNMYAQSKSMKWGSEQLPKITPYNYPQIINEMINKIKYDIEQIDQYIEEM